MPHLDYEIDYGLADIRSITENGEKTIRNSIKSKKKQLKDSTRKTRAYCDSSIHYFHDKTMFNEQLIALELGKSLKSIICVFKDGTIKLYKKEDISN